MAIRSSCQRATAHIVVLIPVKEELRLSSVPVVSRQYHRISQTKNIAPFPKLLRKRCNVFDLLHSRRLVWYFPLPNYVTNDFSFSAPSLSSSRASFYFHDRLDHPKAQQVVQPT